MRGVKMAFTIPGEQKRITITDYQSQRQYDVALAYIDMREKDRPGLYSME